jgi:hypothetical protein
LAREGASGAALAQAAAGLLAGASGRELPAPPPWQLWTDALFVLPPLGSDLHGRRPKPMQRHFLDALRAAIAAAPLLGPRESPQGHYGSSVRAGQLRGPPGSPAACADAGLQLLTDDSLPQATATFLMGEGARRSIMPLL